MANSESSRNSTEVNDPSAQDRLAALQARRQQAAEQTSVLLSDQPDRTERSWNRVAATGASVVSFAAMVVAMGPILEPAESVSATEGEGGATESPAPGASVPVAPTVETPVAPPVEIEVNENPDSIPAPAEEQAPAVEQTTLPPATAAPAPSEAPADTAVADTAVADTAPPPAPTAPPTTAAPAPAPTTAPTTQAPVETPPPRSESSG